MYSEAIMTSATIALQQSAQYQEMAAHQAGQSQVQQDERETAVQAAAGPGKGENLDVTA